MTIVSNNSTDAVEAYLQRNELGHYIRNISARTAADIERLKPDPYLLRHVMESAGTTPRERLMIGDSTTDVEAAHAAGTPVVAYANKPGKRQRLAVHNPEAIIEQLTELIPSEPAA